ncbi:helix-turn-helix domain-containing protein, partial [Kribbella italica]
LFESLTPVQYRAIVQVFAASWHEGWEINYEDVKNLLDETTGAIDAQEYERRVIEMAHARTTDEPIGPRLDDQPTTHPRLIPLEGVQAILSISRSQAYALVRSGELRAIQVGGRGQWRVEHAEFEAYIQRYYEETAQLIAYGKGPTP